MRELAERVARGRQAIALARHRGMDTSSWESWLRDLFEKAGREPGPDAAIEPLMLWQWRRVSILEWRRILLECIEVGDQGREAYARWMLKEILLDPEYEEAQS